MEDLEMSFKSMYRRLYEHFGPQGWWPGDSPFEVCIGAILTQNTTWKNVERAILNLKSRGVLTVEKLSCLDPSILADLIRPAGYYNVKARRIKNFLRKLEEDFSGELERLFALDIESARDWLLSISGIGPETADSILLYAGEKPVFVVDAYTYRVLERHGLIFGDESYQEVQALFVKNLPEDVKLFNEFHALFVAVGKEYCGKRRKMCKMCPLL